MKGVLPFLLMGLLLTSSFISQVGFASEDSTQTNENNQDVLEFNSGVVMDSSSTTTICHIPKGNPGNLHQIVVGTSSLTAHFNHGDNMGECSNQITVSEFLLGNVETDNQTLLDAIVFMNEIISTSSDSKVGPAISQAAKLHKQFAHEDKDIKKLFQQKFLEFVKIIKMNMEKGQGLENKNALNNLGKAAIKVKADIKNEERENEIQNKIKIAIDLKNNKEKLQEIRNKITMAKINHNTNNEEFEGLVKNERKHLNKVLISEAKSNGEKLTGEKIKEIKKSLDSVEINHKPSENTSKSNDGEGPDNKSKGGNDKKSNGKSKGKNK
jgi:hypothetical protein